MTRRLAPRGSGYFVQVEGDGTTRTAGLVAEEGGHVIAALPAALAAEALAKAPPHNVGHLPLDRCLSMDRLLEACAGAHIRLIDPVPPPNIQ